jgi:hypothetical protein
MTLPATFDEAIEAEAVAEARTIIRSVCGEKFTFAPGLTLSRFDKADSRRLGREFFKRLAASSVHRLRGVIECAEAGWTLAREALHELAEECEARDVKPPSRLRLYILGAADPRSRRRGRPPGAYDLKLRDMTLVCIIAVISQRFHFRATRNPASKRSPCACSVVMQALKAERLALSEDSLETLWSRWGAQAYYLIFDEPYPFSR